jgi:hypothetical protein
VQLYVICLYAPSSQWASDDALNNNATGKSALSNKTVSHFWLVGDVKDGSAPQRSILCLTKHHAIKTYGGVEVYV